MNTLISKDRVLLDIVKDNPLLASVVDRFGISYSRWTLTLEEACQKDNVDMMLLLEMLKAFGDSNHFPKEELNKLPLHSIIEYLIKTHIYYINSRLPRIEQFIDLLVDHYGKFDVHLYLLKDYFQDYKRDMYAHICIEERDLFPYVLKMIKSSGEELNSVQLFNLLEENAITRFINEHHHVEDELVEIRRRLNNYSEANNHKVQITTLFYELRMFEIDLLTHGKVEDEILIPRAREIEKGLTSRLLRQARLS
jgi:regulator of cell morphogenesis and NO signaling